MNNYRKIMVLSVLDFLHIQLLSEYIIWTIVLQMHFGVDIYQHNNRLCLHYNQTWLMPVNSSHFTYLHTGFLPAFSPNRPHKMQEWFIKSDIKSEKVAKYQDKAAA